MLRHPSVVALAGATLLALPLQALPQAGGWHDHVDRGGWHRTPVVTGKPLEQPVVVENRSSPARDPMKNAEPNGDDGHRSGHHRGPEKRLIEKYDHFAGSDANARELVTGLRNDSQIDLSKGGKTTKFTPATGKMGWGNVDHALALAKASLAEQGIHKPTPDQIKAALNGGTITTKSGQTVKLDGVLKLRASGMGWGQIAHKMGFKLGELKRADNDHKRGHKKHDGKRDHDKHDRKQAAGKHDDNSDHRKHADWRHDRHDWKRHDRPDFQRAKHDRPHRPERAERPDRHDRPQRPERPERHHHRR